MDWDRHRRHTAQFDGDDGDIPAIFAQMVALGRKATYAYPHSRLEGLALP
jgi:hypothetical protein